MTADPRHPLQRGFNRKFYSRSASLHTSHYCKTEQPYLIEDEAIFARRCRKSEKPKLITLGNSFAMHRPKDSHDSHESVKNEVTRAARRKKEFMLKKQSFTQGMFKDEIVNQKDFIVSLENCLTVM
jgi:hypothetical protein